MTAACVQLIGPTRESTVSIRVLRGLLDAVEQAGVSRTRFLSAAGFSSDQIDVNDARIARSDIYRLCCLAMDLTADPAFGLHWGERLAASAFNPVTDLINHSSTMREGLDSLAKFHPLLTDHASFQIVESNDHVTIVCGGFLGDSLRVKRFAAEMLVNGFFRLLRVFSSHATPQCVSFDYPMPSYATEYERVFEGPVRFDQPFTGLVFERSLMDAASPYKDEDMHFAVRAMAERRILRLARRTPYALRVRELLMQQALTQKADMKTVAHSLGLSVRSLRRRLSSEGRTYGAVANDALASVAKHLLRDKQRTIQETAYEMGFSDTSAFHRAFKRWTGTTPHGYRALALDSDKLG